MHAFFTAHRDAWKPSREFAKLLLRTLPVESVKPRFAPHVWRWVFAVPISAIAFFLVLSAVISGRTAHPAISPSLENKSMPFPLPLQENVPAGSVPQNKNTKPFSAPSALPPISPPAASPQKAAPATKTEPPRKTLPDKTAPPSSLPSQKTESELKLKSSESQAAQHTIVIHVIGNPTRFPKNRVPEVIVPAGAILHLSVSITPVADIEHARLEVSSFSPDVTILTKLPHEIAQLHRGKTVMYDFSLRLPDTAKDVRYPLGVLLIESFDGGQKVSVGPLDLVVGNPTYLRP